MFRVIRPDVFAAFAGELTVGLASRDATPAVEAGKTVWLAGFGQGRKATKIHDPIMVRAVVMSDGKTTVAMACADVVGLFNPFAEGVRAELKEIDHVLVSATHNHEGPDTMGMWGPNPFFTGQNPVYMKKLHDAFVAAIRDAKKAMRPATAEIARKAVPELLNDSRQPIVLHDELVVLRFKGAKDGKPIGLLVQWNCHPETLDSGNLEVSSDFVGPAVADLEKSEKVPVAYFTGTVGGLLSSLKVKIKDEKGNLPKDGSFEKNDLYGRTLAEACRTALKTAEKLDLTPFDCRSQQILLPIENKLYQLAWTTKIFNRAAYVWEGKAVIDPKNPPRQAKDLSTPVAVKSEVGLWRLGELAVPLIPGEIYPELVLGKVQTPADPGADFPEAPVEPSAYDAPKAKYRMIVGLANDEIGYIIPKRQWDEKPPYCYGRTKSQYGEGNSVGPEAAPIIMKALAGLAK